MEQQRDLFSAPTYPTSPGFKERGGTSEQAASEIESHAATVREKVRRLLEGGAQLTADEIAGRLKEDRLTVRPRLSELEAHGLAIKTEKRRRNASGKYAAVWRAA